MTYLDLIRVLCSCCCLGWKTLENLTLDAWTMGTVTILAYKVQTNSLFSEYASLDANFSGIILPY